MFKGRIVPTVLVAVAATMSIGLAAHAETFAMSSQLRNFCCTDWIDRTATPAPNPGGGAFGFIGGVVEQGALVSRTVEQDLAGGAPFDLSIPASRIGTHFSTAGFLHPNPLFDTLSLAVDIDNEAGHFSAGGGPGSFEFCPAMVGPAPGACSTSVLATSGTGPSPHPHYGRIAVEAGPNQFGGTMGWLGPGLHGVINARNFVGVSASVFTARHFRVPFSVIGDNVGLSYTAPTAAGIMAFAPLQAVASFYSTSMHATNPTAVPLSTSVRRGRASGHIWTTGMVQASVLGAGAMPFMAVTVTGSDNREVTGPDRGHGNLTLVSASLTQDFYFDAASVRANVLSMTLPEPAAGMLVGVCTLGLLLIAMTRPGAGRRAAYDGRNVSDAPHGGRALDDHGLRACDVPRLDHGHDPDLVD